MRHLIALFVAGGCITEPMPDSPDAGVMPTADGVSCTLVQATRSAMDHRDPGLCLLEVRAAVTCRADWQTERTPVKLELGLERLGNSPEAAAYTLERWSRCGEAYQTTWGVRCNQPRVGWAVVDHPVWPELFTIQCD